jgi:hypothetical protein
MPSDVDDHLGSFDRFAGAAGSLVSRAPSFAASVLIVILWLVEGLVRIGVGGWREFLDDTYQLQSTASHDHDDTLRRDIEELRAAVGLEEREGTKQPG